MSDTYFKFKDNIQICTEYPLFDLIEGNIDVTQVLKTEEQVSEVIDALITINTFIKEAKELNLISTEI